MAQMIWRCSVDLPCNDSGGISHGLLEADCGCTPIIGADIHIKEREVQTLGDQRVSEG